MSTTPFPLPIMLDAADRKALRARAHHLDPVVMIGESGLTRAVLDEADRALRAHELIKIRVLGDDRAQRQAMSTEICSALGCTAVQSIGKLLVLYRPKPIEDNSTTHVPKKRAAQGAGAAAKKTPAARKRASAPAKTAAARKRAPVPAKTPAARKRASAPAARKRAPARRTSASTSASASAQRTTTQRPRAESTAPRARRDRAKKA